MTEIDLSPLTEKLSAIPNPGRTNLLPALHAAQEIYGYLPEPAVTEIGRYLNIPFAEISGVIDFYTMFYRRPVGENIVRICCDPACAIAGSDALLEGLQSHSRHNPGQSGHVAVEKTTCIGLCQHAPAGLLGTDPIGGLDPARVEVILRARNRLLIDTIGGDLCILTSGCKPGLTVWLGEYLDNGGYGGFSKALSLKKSQIIDMVKASGLVGRGGAAFPTGIKWEACASASSSPKYIICNADESEPGTFKDRILMESNPHRLLEGILIAALAIGANQGYLYVRGEYQASFRILRDAVQEAYQENLLGSSILGSGFNFNLELRLGAGAYICGEETALFESIEGKRGFPRIKPPYPTTHGLFGKPTVINNVETLCNVPFILEHGVDAFRANGTQKSPGTKLFCLSGDVNQPGVYEVPFGISLGDLVFRLGGGIPDGSEFQAALIGGAAGAFATSQHLDVPMTFEDLSAAGLPLGSGVVMVFNDQRDLLDILQRLAAFFAHESCGKCYPCQMGTQRQLEVLTRYAQGVPIPGDAERLSDVGWTMTDASLCGLGQTAASAILSAMKLWPEKFQDE